MTITYTKESAELPVGSLMAWDKDLVGVPQIISGEWMLCDGSTVNDPASPLYLSTVPDLNGDNRFLSGHPTTDGALVGSDTHTHGYFISGSFNHFVSGTVFADGISGTLPAASNVPPYYHVVWIIKVR